MPNEAISGSMKRYMYKYGHSAIDDTYARVLLSRYNGNESYALKRPACFKLARARCGITSQARNAESPGEYPFTRRPTARCPNLSYHTSRVLQP